jgi:hypothetical protein
MAFIETGWEQYFSDAHEGLGTTYERFVLHRHFERLRADFAVSRVLEAPSFGMTGVSGINSLWWAANGAATTVLDDHPQRVNLIRRVWRELALPVHCLAVRDFGALPLRERSFDMSWNFAALGFLAYPEACLAELARVTRRVIFICVPNDRSIGYAVRAFSGGTAATRTAGPRRIESALQSLGWHVVERGYLDVPPWPDIAMKKEDLLKKIGLGVFVPQPDRPPGKRLCILDYFSGRDPAMESSIMRYALLERAPALIKMLWAHHRYMVFAPA